MSTADPGTRERLARGIDRLPVDVEDSLRQVRRRAARRELASRAATVALAVGVAAVGIVGVWKLVALRSDSRLGVGPGGRIAYTAIDGETETFEIFSATGDGSDASPLLSSGESAYGPVWNPDGSRVAFMAGGAPAPFDTIRVMDAGGGAARTIVEIVNPVQLSWSPDGSRIAYVEGGEGVWIVNADGSDAHRVIDGIWRNVAWSPDGEVLLLAGSTSPDFGDPTDLFTVQLDGTGLTPLTSTEGDEDFPAWSPDGSRIAFVRHESTGDDVDFHSDIFVINSDGSGEGRLTDWPGFDAFPVWSPDGSRILFASDRHLSEQQRERNKEQGTLAGASLFVLDPETGQADLLIDGGNRGLVPSSWIG